ncbi:hypothetical protein ACKKBF_B16060 [Auxenochlorella protothecoides x Auxenochlorella symbiontica]
MTSLMYHNLTSCFDQDPFGQQILAAALPTEGEESVSDELNAPEYSTDEFRMFQFKVERCGKRCVHDWRCCPFAHPTENARRRDPRLVEYLPVPCPDYKRGICLRGDACPYSHGVYECWLHPAKYRTQLCKEGPACRRPVCFFAHAVRDLRQPTHTPGEGSGPRAMLQCAAAGFRGGPGPNSAAHARRTPPSALRTTRVPRPWTRPLARRRRPRVRWASTPPSSPSSTPAWAGRRSPPPRWPARALAPTRPPSVPSSLAWAPAAWTAAAVRRGRAMAMTSRPWRASPSSPRRLRAASWGLPAALPGGPLPRRRPRAPPRGRPPSTPPSWPSSRRLRNRIASSSMPATASLATLRSLGALRACSERTSRSLPASGPGCRLLLLDGESGTVRHHPITPSHDRVRARVPKKHQRHAGAPPILTFFPRPRRSGHSSHSVEP